MHRQKKSLNASRRPQSTKRRKDQNIDKDWYKHPEKYEPLIREQRPSQGTTPPSR